MRPNLNHIRFPEDSSLSHAKLGLTPGLWYRRSARDKLVFKILILNSAPTLLGAGGSRDTLQRQFAFVYYPHFPDRVTEAPSYHSVITCYNGKLQAQRALVPGHTADVGQTGQEPGHPDSVWGQCPLGACLGDVTPKQVQSLSSGALCANWKAETHAAVDWKRRASSHTHTHPPSVPCTATDTKPLGFWEPPRAMSNISGLRGCLEKPPPPPSGALPASKHPCCREALHPVRPLPFLP